MGSEAARTARDAWEALRAEGGIELGGRDIDFEPKLLAALSTTASTLEDALDEASTDDLVRALFSVTSPYLEMFSAILKFFERATANEGRQQWSVVIDDAHLDLRHFQEAIRVWEALDCEFDVPAVDASGSWIVWKAAANIPQLLNRLGKLQNTTPQLSINGLDNWFAAYDAGEYLSLPAGLQPTNVPPKLQDAAAILEAAIQIIRSHWSGRESMLKAIRDRSYRHDSTNGFEAWTIAMAETDYRLRSGVLCLALALESGQEVLQAYEARFRELAGSYGRKKVGIHAPLDELQRLLSLPVWQHRHELYAVWIATEVVRALPEHQIELHQEGGRITFSFGGSVVATINSTRPKVRLHSERRTQLDAPVGAGRVRGVQPDYTLWRGVAPTDVCGLVVEVKHYKKNAPSKFKEVLVDYARAHPQAHIVLVSHGPTTDYVDEGGRSVISRCHTIAELTVSNLDAREKLAEYVRNCVGKPIDLAANPLRSVGALVVDVSSSMHSALTSAEMRELLDEVSPSLEVVLVDTEIRARTQAKYAMAVLESLQLGGATALEPAVCELLGVHNEVLVVTDEDGHGELVKLGAVTLKQQQFGMVVLRLLRVGSV